jgi:serine/threonine protein kinase
MPISQNKGVGIFGKIIMACSFAEKNNILHRDIKPANILFKDGEPRVADWGFSRYLKE